VQRLAPVLTVAAISGLVVTTYQISFGSLIFSGNLAVHLSAGIGFCLMGVVLIGGDRRALFSGNPGHGGHAHGRSAVIIATTAANIARELRLLTPGKDFPNGDGHDNHCFFAHGWRFPGAGLVPARNLIRYIPYPVIGGFLAGTGWPGCQRGDENDE